MRVSKPSGSKRVIGPAPEQPARRPAQVAATSSPTGVTAPRPVMTTRRRLSMSDARIWHRIIWAGGRGSNWSEFRYNSPRRRPSVFSQVTAEPVARLIDEFNRLPGIGPKTAQRLTYFLLRAPSEQAHALAEAL